MSAALPVVLTVAGSDSGGGAGIQADIKAITAAGGHAVSCITATTAQNSAGVEDVHVLPDSHLKAQLQAVLSDFAVAAAKTGMLPTAKAVELIAEAVSQRGIPLVIDPVLIATSGHALSGGEVLNRTVELLCPTAALITPNQFEAEFLLGRPFGPAEARDVAAELADRLGCPVLLKGGDAASERVFDHLARGSQIQTYESERLFPGSRIHGTGCTLSAAIAAFLAQGLELAAAVEKARDLTARAISKSQALGRGARVLTYGL